MLAGRTARVCLLGVLEARSLQVRALLKPLSHPSSRVSLCNPEHAVSGGVLQGRSSLKSSERSQLTRQQTLHTHCSGQLQQLLAKPSSAAAPRRQYSGTTELHSRGIVFGKTLAVPVVSLISITADGADVALKVGKMEEIRVEVAVSPAPPANAPFATWDKLKLRRADNYWGDEMVASVDLFVDLRKYIWYLNGMGAHPRYTTQVTAWIPERFCSARIKVEDGDLDIQQIKEASLEVEGANSHVRLGTVSATRAKVASLKAGKVASITGGSVTADHVRLYCEGGPITLQRVMGNLMLLRTTSPAGGPGHAVDVQAIYGKGLNISSGGADVAVGTLKCEGTRATINTIVKEPPIGLKLQPAKQRAGTITINCLDGNATLITGGGDISLQVHEQMGRVIADSKGGRIACQASPAVSAAVTLLAGNITVSPDLPFHAVGQPSVKDGIKGVIASKSGGSEYAQAAIQSDSVPEERQQASLHLDAGPDGSIELTARSWIESVRDSAGLT